MNESHQLTWRANGDGFALYFKRRPKPLLHVVADKTYAGMWRMRFANGRAMRNVRL